MANDFQAKGEWYNYLLDTFYLSITYADMIAQNTIQAAQILKATCKSGAMKFDLDLQAHFSKQTLQAPQCD